MSSLCLYIESETENRRCNKKVPSGDRTRIQNSTLGGRGLKMKKRITSPGKR